MQTLSLSPSLSLSLSLSLSRSLRHPPPHLTLSLLRKGQGLKLYIARRLLPARLERNQEASDVSRLKRLDTSCSNISNVNGIQGLPLQSHYLFTFFFLQNLPEAAWSFHPCACAMPLPLSRRRCLGRWPPRPWRLQFRSGWGCSIHMYTYIYVYIYTYIYTYIHIYIYIYYLV